MTRPLSILFLNVVCFSMVIVFFCIMERVKLNEKVFGFLGKISFEIYLYHGLVILLLRNAFWYLPGDLPYALCVMGLSIALTWLMHKVHGLLYQLYSLSTKILSLPSRLWRKTPL